MKNLNAKQTKQIKSSQNGNHSDSVTLDNINAYTWREYEYECGVIQFQRTSYDKHTHNIIPSNA